MRVAVFVLAAVPACGGNTSAFGDDGATDGNVTLDAGAPAPHDASGHPDVVADTVISDADTEPLPPECPDAADKPANFTCDPLAPSQTQCPVGEACYAWVVDGANACDPSQAMSACSSEGTSGEGAPCDEAFDCAAGLACVYSKSYVCTPFCMPWGSGECSDGKICEQIAGLPGLGACT